MDSNASTSLLQSTAPGGEGPKKKVAYFYDGKFEPKTLRLEPHHNSGADLLVQFTHNRGSGIVCVQFRYVNLIHSSQGSSLCPSLCLRRLVLQLSFPTVHPMKPHRIKMAHNLILNYGLDKKMDVLVRTLPVFRVGHRPRAHRCPAFRFQKPVRSTAHEMTKFHTDEYVDFLTRVSPETVEEMSGGGTRCESSSFRAGFVWGARGFMSGGRQGSGN